MRFVLRMAAREARSSWRRLAFFFAGVAVGVAAIVAVRSLIESVRATIGREARALTAADVVVQTNRPWDPETRAGIERRLAGASVLARSEVVATATMALAGDSSGDAGESGARLVEVRAVQEGFPFYGQVVLAGSQPYSHSLLKGRGVLAAPELLSQLGLKLGDTLKLGGRPYTVRGVLLREPGRRPTAFSLGPRVLVDQADLLASGLLAFGSRAQYQLLLKLPEPDIEPLVRALQGDFKRQFVSVRSYRETSDQLGDGLRRSEAYLGLVAFVILVLGGIGVGSVVRVFVQEKLRSIAVLKCLGASGRRVLAVYVVQVVLLGLLGSAGGVALAGGALALVPAGWGGSFGDVRFGLSPQTALQGLASGLIVALLFALPALLELRRVKPLMLLRHETDARTATWRDPARVAVLALIVAGLVALAAWQAGSVRGGLVASAGFAVLASALQLAGALLVRVTAGVARRTRFPVRQALLHLSRPGNQTRPVLLAVGLGSFLILTVQALQRDLVAQFALELREDAADMFLLDVQKDQRARVAELVASASGREPRLVPVLRARVTGVRGRELNLDGVEDVRGRGSLGREYVVTWRQGLEPNERVIAGRLWAAGDAGEPEVSIEESLRRRFGIQVGDDVRFDLLGRIVTARVTSVREVVWSDARSAGGFMFLFRPGSLRGAPETYLGFAKGPSSAEGRARLQRDLATAFPNVSAVDLRDVLSALRALLSDVSRAVSVVGGVTLLSGLLILFGSVAVTRHRRRYEASILRTLGARTRGVAALLGLEYAALGAVAGAVGALGSLGLTAALARFVLDLPWTPDLGLCALGVGLTALGVCAVGTLASLDVVRRKPLLVLRAE